METPAITKYVELAREQVSVRGEAFDCVRGEGSAAAKDRYNAIVEELDTLWCAMDRDEQDETERRLGPLRVYSAAYDNMQCHACSVVIFTRRRFSSLPWRAISPDAHPLHCNADPIGPTFLLCQECAAKALEACDHVSYEQLIEDRETQLSERLVAGFGASPEDTRERIDALLVGHKRLIDLQQAQIADLKRLDASAESTIRSARDLEAHSSKLIENQAGLIDAQAARIDNLERLVRALGGVLPEPAQA